MIVKYKEVEKYIENLNEIGDINTLTLIYRIIKNGGCKITITSKNILCYINSDDVVNDILTVKHYLHP